MDFNFQYVWDSLANLVKKLNQLQIQAKEIINHSNFCKNFFIGLLFLMIILGLILMCIWSSLITSINSQIHIEKQNELLKQNYVTNIYTNSSCDGNEEVSYQISATIDGCKCSEQLYAQSCTKSQIEQQNCSQINSQNSYKVNQFSFQQNDNLNFALKICYNKSKTSMYEQIRQKNKCSNEQKQCEDKENNNHICVMSGENCPISNFEIQKQNQINEKQKHNRIKNTQTNQGQIIGIIVTNGFCDGRLNSSTYILNKQQDDCQFAKYMNTIAKYPVQQILEVNKIKEYHKITRKYDDLQNQLYVINSLKYSVPLQCRLDNKIFDQQDKILNYEKVLYCMSIFILICYLPSLYIIYSTLHNMHIRMCNYLMFYGFIFTLIVIQLLISIIYQYNLQKDCHNFELAKINYIYHIINSIVIIIQFLIALLINPSIQVGEEDQNQNQNQLGTNQHNQNGQIQSIQQDVFQQQYNLQQQIVAHQPNQHGRFNQGEETHQEDLDVANQQNQDNDIIQSQQITIQQNQNASSQNQIIENQRNQEMSLNVNIDNLEIQSLSSFQSTISRNTQNNQESQMTERQREINNLNRFKGPKSLSRKKLIINRNQE